MLVEWIQQYLRGDLWLVVYCMGLLSSCIAIYASSIFEIKWLALIGIGALAALSMLALIVTDGV